jgi:WD40 repeat protein
MNASLPSLSALPAAEALRLEQVCKRFEDAWKTGPDGPTLEAFLADGPEPARSALLCELLRLELAYRRRAGEQPTEAEYRARFPGHEALVRAILAEPSREGGGSADAQSTRDPVTAPTRLPPPESATTADAASSAPLQVPGYEVLEPLGRGGMGAVFKARQLGVGRIVALKVIRADYLQELKGEENAEELRKWIVRFRWEAEAVAALDHPHIVPLYQVGEHEGLPYFSMKLVEGGSLAGQVERFQRDHRAAADLMAVAARAVHHAHQRQILHRDLKPANILLGADGQPHVTDFGLALRIGPGRAGLSLAGALVGTPEYMAPEQVRAERDLTTAVDVYGLGAVLYHLLTGRPPHQGVTQFDTFMHVLEKEPQPPRALNPQVARDLEVICLKCLEKDPSRRYGSTEALAEDLKRWLRGQPIRARRVGALEGSWLWCHRNPVVACLTALLLLALLGGLAGTTLGMIEARRQRDDAELARRNEAEQRAAALRERDDKEQARQAEAAERAKADAERKKANTERAKAVTERDARQREAIRADGLRLAAEAKVAVRTDPALALRLAAEGARKYPHHLTFRALHEALGELREERTLAEDDDFDSFHSARYSADGRRLWVVRDYPGDRSKPGQAPAVTILDRESGRRLGSWPGVLRVEDFEVSPDEQWLAVAHGEGFAVLDFTDGREPKSSVFTSQVVHLIDAATGKGVRNLGRHDDWITSARFSPDSRRLVTASADKTARVWEVATGKCLCRMAGHTMSLLSAQFSPDGRRVLTITSEKDRRFGAGIGDLLTKITVTVQLDGMRTLSGGDLRKLGLHAAWSTQDDAGNVIPVDPIVTDRPAKTPAYFGGHHGSRGGDVKLAGLWDAATGKPLVTYRKTRPASLPANHVWTPTAGMFNPDGTKVIIAFDNGTVALWDSEAGGEEKLVLAGHERGVNKIVFSPDGSRIATAGDDKTARVWDAATGRELSRLRHEGAVSAVKFDKLGRYLLTQSSQVQVWDVATGAEIAHLRSNGSFNEANFTPDGTHVITAGRHSVSLWSLAPLPGPERVLAAHKSDLTAFAYSPTGSQLLTAAADGTAKLFDPATGRLLRTLGTELKHARMQSASFSPDGKFVVTASEVKEVKQGGSMSPWSVHVWDTATGVDRFQLRDHVTGATFASFTPDGSRLLTVGDGRRTVQGPFISWSLATRADAGVVRLWDVPTQRLLVTLPARTLDPPRFSGDGRVLLLRPEHKREGELFIINKYPEMPVYDGMIGKELRRLGVGAPQKAKETLQASLIGDSKDVVVVSPDGRRALTARYGQAALWDLTTGNLVALFDKSERSIHVAAFSPDSARVVVAGGKKGYVLSAASGVLEAILVGHEGDVTAVAFSPNGMYLLTGSEDKTAARWRTSTGQLEAVYIGHEAAIHFVAYRPDGQQVATATASGEVRLWPLDPVAEVLRHAPRDLNEKERQRYSLPAAGGQGE